MEEKKILLIATGGTIAGVGARGKTARYESGTLTAEDLIREVPALTSVAEAEAIQVCNINSDDVTGGIWIDLAERINAMAADPSQVYLDYVSQVYGCAIDGEGFVAGLTADIG